ncbi:MAG: biosynthetic-type acetolactate synthase large subunit, partial [Dehalococcoidia bacterium]|nr:biosynthetic-type acetolactate synthase large subunit [Dehalococcoidia bacterium]
MRRTGAQIVWEMLEREGVEVVFGFPGGAIMHTYHPRQEYGVRHILVRHEQCAAHAADGYARASGRVGVAMVTSGPGATNLVTGIATAMMDSSPIVCITGQVPTAVVGSDAFQEADITGITLPITKHNYLVLGADEIAVRIKEAFHIAGTGRPGPVLLDIPRDVFIEEATFSYPEKVEIRGYKPTVRGHAVQIKKAAKLISESKRPVILAGRGVLISRATEELKELAQKEQIPVITTLLGVSSFPEDHELSLGMMGMHGTAYANLAVDAADLVIAIGMRFDDRATGRVSGFAPHAQIIHIDIDPAEIGKNVRVTMPIVGEVRNVLKSLNKQLEVKTHLEWVAQVEEWKREHPLHVDHEGDNIPPQYVVSKICEVTGSDAIIVTGVGQNQMWAA